MLFPAIAFAQARPFIPKQSQELPDNYGVKICFVTGTCEEFELASHFVDHDTNMFEFATKDDVWNWVPLSSVLRIEFDKRFSKIVSLKEKQINARDKQGGSVGSQSGK